MDSIDSEVVYDVDLIRILHEWGSEGGEVFNYWRVLFDHEEWTYNPICDYPLSGLKKTLRSKRNEIKDKTSLYGGWKARVEYHKQKIGPNVTGVVRKVTEAPMPIKPGHDDIEYYKWDGDAKDWIAKYIPKPEPKVKTYRDENENINEWILDPVTDKWVRKPMEQPKTSSSLWVPVYNNADYRIEEFNFCGKSQFRATNKSGGESMTFAINTLLSEVHATMTDVILKTSPKKEEPIMAPITPTPTIEVSREDYIDFIKVAKGIPVEIGSVQLSTTDRYYAEEKLEALFQGTIKIPKGMDARVLLSSRHNSAEIVPKGSVIITQETLDLANKLINEQKAKIKSLEAIPKNVLNFNRDEMELIVKSVYNIKEGLTSPERGEMKVAPVKKGWLNPCKTCKYRFTPDCRDDCKYYVPRWWIGFRLLYNVINRTGNHWVAKEKIPNPLRKGWPEEPMSMEGF